MKKCAVCEADIGSDLEEFGDPREPVCASCWLSGKSPEDELRELLKKNNHQLKEKEMVL